MVSMMVIGPGIVILSFFFVCARASRASVRMHAALQSQLADHLRHHRFVAVGADAHLDLVGEVDAVDEFEKAVHEMLARHLAVGDDIDAGIFLLLQREQGRVGLRGGKLIAGELPLRPELVRSRRAMTASAGFRQLSFRTCVSSRS